MDLGLTLKVNDSKLQAFMRQAVSDGLNTIYAVRGKIFEDRIRTLVKDTMEASITLQSIDGGTLQGHLGIENPSAVINPIISSIVGSLNFKFSKFRALRGGLQITCQPKDYANLLNLGVARYVSVNKSNGTSYLIDWLEWLLTMGDTVIITNYHVSFGDYEHSRSGQAVMIPTGSWHVPKAHAGTIDNNFITRALELENNTNSPFKTEFDAIFKSEIIDFMNSSSRVYVP